MRGVRILATKNNEQILAALVATGSVRAAAKAVGVSETTIRARLNDPDFRKEYETAKGAVLTEACDSLAARLTHAVEVLVDVLDNTENAATVRVSAADSLLRHGLRYIEMGNILLRLDALEQRTNGEG